MEETALVELLAPAGSREALKAAVESGADAVYLAGSSFGARAYADNFDDAGLREAIQFAHLRQVRIHVTVNTLVSDEEMPALAGYVRFLYEAGADAVLVQDLGAARIIHEAAPDLPMHASTQMTVHNLAGVLALERLGFARVVLSRELSLQDIRYIQANSHIELEVFMHGALCICYSGQCLMSSMIGGRSGNRGRCAQPCRLPYALVDGRGNEVLADKAGKYLLSPRDLNTIEILPELIGTGIASLKIEGRMKRPEYVATVVRTYRQAIDRCEAGKKDGYQVPEDDKEALAQIFNRDFTTAYLEKKQGKDMMSDRRPNNRGLLIGRVAAYDADQHRVSVKLSGSLLPGDQVDFWVKVGGRVTATIDDLRQEQAGVVSFPLPVMVHEHDRVFKVFDAALMETARSYFKNGAPVRRVGVDAFLQAAVGEPLVLSLTDIDGNEAVVRSSFIGEPARKRPLTDDIVHKQLARLGTTIFSLRQLRTEIKGEVMVPMSELNEVRRQAVADLEEKRLNAYARPALPAYGYQAPQSSGRRVSQSAIFVSVDTLPGLAAALKAGADGILFGGESYQHEQLPISVYKQAAALVREQGRYLAFNTPRIVTETWMPAFQKLLAGFAKLQPDEVYVHNIGMLDLVKAQGLPVHADASLSVYNHEALSFLQSYGVQSVTLSPELTLQQVEKIAAARPLPLECIVAGRLELMISEYCVAGSFLGDVGKGKCTMPCVRNKTGYFLRDRKDILFPLYMDQFCHMHVLNSHKLSMLPHAMRFAKIGIDRMRIEGRAMTEPELRDTVENYRHFRDSHAELLPEELAHIKELEGKDITRGHYFRGVL